MVPSGKFLWVGFVAAIPPAGYGFRSTNGSALRIQFSCSRSISAKRWNVTGRRCKS